MSYIILDQSQWPDFSAELVLLLWNCEYTVLINTFDHHFVYDFERRDLAHTEVFLQRSLICTQHVMRFMAATFQ